MPYKDKQKAKEVSRKSSLKYFYKNKDKQRHSNKLWRQRMRNNLLSHYSNGLMKCACCGENTIEFLTLDHINNNGSLERRKYSNGGHQNYRRIIKMGYPSGIQVLCYNCNCGRAKTVDKICPHKKNRI